MLSQFPIDVSKLTTRRRVKIETQESTLTTCRKIQLYPSRTQRVLLNRWRLGYNRIYNYTLGYIRWNKHLGYRFFTILPIIMKQPRYKRLIALYDLPLVFGHEAVKECCKAFKIAFANLRNRNIKRFKVGYKRSSSKTIVVSGNCFSKKVNGFCITKLGEMRSSASIVGSKESKLTVEGGRTYLYVPVQTPTFKVVGSRKECALDPGVRTFQTMYCSRGVKEYGKRVSDKLAKVHKKLKTLDSRKGTPNSRGRVRWYEKARNKVYSTLKSSIKQLHWNTALHLVKQFDTIYIGSFCESSKRCISRGGKLSKVTRFATNALSHFTFLQRLRYKAEQYGKKVVIVDESYTSKTCGSCFELNDVGSSKIYNCDSCKLSIDRDVNGARNIMLRAKGRW